MRKFFICLAFFLTTFASAEGMGDLVEFDSSSTTSAVIVSAGPNIVISWEQLEPVEDTFSNGNANSFANASNQSDPVILGVGDIFGLSAIANGGANSGDSNSFAGGAGVLSISNNGFTSESFEVENTWSISADSLGVLPDTSNAFADVFILDGFIPVLNNNVASLSFNEDGTVDLSGVFSLTGTLNAGDTRFFNYLNTANGAASAAVPEPSSLVVLLTCPFLGLTRRRKE